MRLASALVLFAFAAYGQFSGRISGTVLDASGSAVANADVRLLLPGGSKPLFSAKTSSDGAFRFIGIRSSDYDLAVEAKGFVKATVRKITVDPARETDVATIKLELPTVTQSIDVSADEQSVQISNAEVSSTITMEQVHKLPVLDRDPLGLIQTQAGVVSNGNTPTVINGLRTSYANVTLDGINIQDNYLRDNALDYTPNKLLLGQVHEMTLITSNQNAAASGGSAQLVFATPSGTNELHGGALWYNRNNYFSANDWFNNQAGVARPFLNQNTFGGSLGGPIKRDKLFFYTNYEAVRTRQQSPANTTILTSDARNGIFTYNTTAGVTRKVDLLALRKISIDPYIQNLLSQVPGPGSINNFQLGDSAAGQLKNTAGYRFDQRANETRDNVTAKIDYNLSTKHAFTGTYAWNRDNTDRPDFDNDYAAVPKSTNPNHSHFLSLAWHWTPSAHLTNELRGGFNKAPGDFLTSQKFGSYLVTGTIFSDPVNEMLPQGRATNTYSISDNAAYQRGRHYLQFGFQTQQIRVHSYDDVGIIANYSLAMGTGQTALQRSDLPGISSGDLVTANALLATLGGYVDGYTQTFNVTSRTSGYVPNAANTRNFRLSEYGLYAQDNWKVWRRLTLTLGLRYQIPGVADERDSLELLPVVQNNNPVQTLLSNATLNFAGASVGRPWYNRDTKDFAPNVGLAWDVFGNGKTAFRAGYAISYVNDQALVAPETMLEANPGLTGLSSAAGLSGRVSTNLPKITPPAYQVPLTVADNYASNPFNTSGLIDPNLRTPYVQQYSVGIQQEYKRTVFEARYVGNHAVRGYRAFDYNQVIIKQNGFLNDFLRAQNNGFLAQAKNGGVFNPAYNPAIPGSQTLPVFAQLFRAGLLTNSTVRNLIQTGQVGTLAETYQVDGYNGSVNFFANPYTLGADMLNNYSNSTYNSLQVEVRHRARAGLSFQGNYTFSKVLSDAAGDSQSRIEHFLDINNPKIERARANFDLTHAIKGNATYDLPIGEKHWIHYRRLDRVIGGWALGGIMTWQSGAPFSILSGRGTLNRSDGFRSQYNTADTSLTKARLDGVVKYQMTGNGPVFISQSAINPLDGTGVSGDGTPAFNGEVFSNPGAGTIGTLQRRMFSGPWSFDLDMSLQKTFKITERHTVELRMEGVNILNHPTFFVDNQSTNQSINSQTFGVITSTFNPTRIMQFALHYQF